MSDDSPVASADVIEEDSIGGDFADDADVNEYSLQPTVSGFPCEYCGKKVKTKNGLHKHKKRYHDNERRQLMKFLCSEGCNTGFPHLNLLRTHYTTKHDLRPNQIAAQFPSVDAFESWKESEEQTTCSKFVVKDRRSAGQKGRTRIMYWCHRSGEAGESKGRSRAKTPRNAAKTGIICTAAINVFINTDGTVDMNYFPEHWGHDRDAQYLFLSREQRHAIAQQLTDGVTPEEIIESCQSSDNIRLKKVTRTTIYRVCRDFSIPWVWGKQESRMNDRSSQSAQRLDELEEDGTRSDEDSTNEVPGPTESLASRQDQGLECLERISTMIVNGAGLSEDDLSSLKAIEERLSAQLANVDQPSNCVVILESEQARQPLSAPVATGATFSRQPPRDLNVAIINYDGILLQR